MKRLFSALMVAGMMLIGSQAFAQISVGAGYKMLSHKSGDESTALNGFYAGADYNFALGSSGLGIAPGLQFTYVTKSDAESGSVLAVKGDFNEMYLSVPVRLNYKANLSNDIKLVLFAGPSVDFGLSSKLKASASVGGVSAEKTYDLYDNDARGEYKRFDVKLGGGVALDILDVTRVSVGYDFGMLNRGSENSTLHSNQLYVGVSLLF